MWIWPSLRLALHILRARWVRNLLLVIVVMLATSLLVGISCGVASVQAGLSAGLARMIGAADVRVIHQFTGGVPWSLRDEITSWPGVREAFARSRLAVELEPLDGLVFAEEGQEARRSYALVNGFELDRDLAVSNLVLREGRTPQNEREIMIDAASAELLPVELGQRLALKQRGGEERVIVVGVYDLERPRLTPSPYLLASVDLVRSLSGRPHEVNELMILLDEGRDPRAFCQEMGPRLESPLVLEPSEMLRIGFDRRLSAVRFGLMVATVIGFLSCAFIIVTGLTTSVTEQQREMAITRCLGAQRRQLFASQVFSGLMISVVGGVLGIPLGIGISWLIMSIFRGDLPVTLTISWLGVLLAIIGALGAGLLGALYPAWLACSTRPITAMSRRAIKPRLTGVVIAAVLGVGLIFLQVGLQTIPDREARFFVFAWIGMPALYIGYFLLAIPLLVICARPVGAAISAVLRLPGGALSSALLATPLRQGLTAGTLMIGIAIGVDTWANGESLLRNWVHQLTFADGFIFAPSGLTDEEIERLEQTDGVNDACALTYAPLRVQGEQVFGLANFAPPNVIGLGVDPESFFAMNRPVWIKGSPEEVTQPLLDGTGVILSDRFLRARGIDVGDTIEFGAGSLTQAFTVVGLIETGGLELATQLIGIQNEYTERAISCAVFDQRTFRTQFALGLPQILEVDADPDVSDEVMAEAISDAVPGSTWRSGRWILETINGVGHDVLLLQSAIAAGALLVASLGLGNILLASIHGRRYEYGVLRSVGLQRGTLVRLILAESTFLALVGAAVGTGLGMHLAWIATGHFRELAGLSIGLSFPFWATVISWIALIVIACLVTIPGLLAAARPSASSLVSAGRNQ